MKKIILTITIALSAFTMSNAQILVDKKDITQTVDMFDVWCFTKPFTTKECYFIDYGQTGFKPVNYDLKEVQTIRDSLENKFSKGEWIRLVNYLKLNGYEKTGEHESMIGNLKGRVVTFERKKKD